MDQRERSEAGRVLLGAALRRLRVEAGLNLSEAAEAAGISLSYLSEVERGRKLISLDALDSCAVALGTSVVDILSGVYPFGSSRRPRQVAPPPDARYRSEP